MLLEIPNCYDSHVHWLATGQQVTTLSLKCLKSAHDVRQLQVEPFHFVGEWLTGFGWDHNLWSPPEYPTRHILDEVFPDFPVAFSRTDGHAMWLNTLALKRVGLMNSSQVETPGGQIVREKSGFPSGILIDLAMDPVKALIPSHSPDFIRTALQQGVRYFNERGFTHIRDLSCSLEQWDQATLLDGAGLLTLAVEQYFDAENPERFHQAIQMAVEARKHKCQNLRVQGIKVYYDGALGSEGALLSCPYCSGSGYGLQLMQPELLREILIEAWDKQLSVAVHVIGDEAAHQVALVARRLWDLNYRGRLELEHAQLMRPETIELLRGRSVICHMQPCHWLSDKRWLEQKIKPLMHHLFPWARLAKNNIPFDFGSDSPIEESSLQRNIHAVEDASLHGIALPPRPAWIYQSHLDQNWTPETKSHFNVEKIVQVTFRGLELF